MRYLIGLMAARRLTTLVTEDEITEDLRTLVDKRFGEDSKLSTLVHCRACVSVWAGLGTTGLLIRDNGAGRVLVSALALSESVLLVDRILDKYLPKLLDI